MITDLMPAFQLVMKWYNFDNAKSQTLTDAQMTSDFVTDLKAMSNYADATSQAEKNYFDAVQTYCQNFIANFPVLGA